MLAAVLAAGCEADDADRLAGDGDDTAAVFDSDPECFGIEPAPGEVECGNVEVPLHHDDPDGETVRLAVAVLPTSGADERDEPLLVLGGGSGAHMVDPMLTDRGLRSHYDVGSELIVVDQRGAGASEPALECRGAKEGAALTTEPDDADTMVDAVSDCRERLVADGVDLDGFNHTANADDLEMVHRAPGPSPHGPHVS